MIYRCDYEWRIGKFERFWSLHKNRFSGSTEDCVWLKMPFGKLNPASHSGILFLNPSFDKLYKIEVKIVGKVNKVKNKKNDIVAISAETLIDLMKNNKFSEFKEEIKREVAELVKRGHEVNLVIDGNATFDEVSSHDRVKYSFDGKEMQNLIKLNDELKEIGLKDSIKFNEFFWTSNYRDLETCWDLEDVVKANLEIDKVVKRIKELKLSQYEAMVYIHKYITKNYEYGFHSTTITREDMRERINERDRSMISAIQDKMTVCVGFAALTKAIIDRLNMPGLICAYEYADVYERDKNTEEITRFQGGHCLNKIDITDKKYEIDGTYLSDATIDSRSVNHPNGCGYGYFMYHISDTKDFKNPLGKRPWGTLVYGEKSSEYKEFHQSKGVSEPIEYNKLTQAMKVVYSKADELWENGDFEKTLKDDMDWTLITSYEERIESSSNCFKKKCEELFDITKDDKGRFIFKSKNRDNPVAEIKEEDIAYLEDAYEHAMKLWPKLESKFERFSKRTGQDDLTRIDALSNFVDTYGKGYEQILEYAKAAEKYVKGIKIKEDISKIKEDMESCVKKMILVTADCINNIDWDNLVESFDPENNKNSSTNEIEKGN